MNRIACAIVLLLAATVSAHAQQEVEWKQVLNMPKGQNIPLGSGNILGIELGDSYAEAKEKMQKLLSEAGPPPSAAPAPKSVQERKEAFMGRMASQMDGQRQATSLTEERKVFRFQTPGASSVVTASFIGKVKIERELPGVSQRKILEFLTVYLSAPASGHQVVAIERSISYPTEQDQPRVSEVVANLKDKMKAPPQAYDTIYVFQYNDGKIYVPPRATSSTCTSRHGVTNSAMDLRNVNTTGDCDAVLRVSVNAGISRDHASALSFELVDHERLKSNMTADFAFVQDYIKSMQQQTRGAPPKL